MNEQISNRRELLKTGTFAVIEAALAGSGTINAEDGKDKKTPDANFDSIKAADGASLYFKDWNGGGKETLLFLHSWGVNSDIWQYQMMSLAEEGFRCVAFDRRGHGRSSQTWNGYDYDTFASDLNAVIEGLKLNDLTLISHSMAGGEIVRYLTRFGAKRVSRAVITSPTLPFPLKTVDNPNGLDKTFVEKFGVLLQADVQATLRNGVEGFFGFRSKVSKDFIEWAIRLFDRTSLRALTECSRANVETDFRAEMKKISVPILIIHGSDDLSAPPELTAKRAAEILPNARLKIYPNAPHGIILTHKEEMAKDIANFAGGKKND